MNRANVCAGEITFQNHIARERLNASIRWFSLAIILNVGCHDNRRRAFPTLWFSSVLQPHLVQHSRRARKMASVEAVNKVTYKRQRVTGEFDQLIVLHTSP